ncbi:hypothetical protein BG011_008144 [Mortierella polycephala]|uniref:CBM21 domain-containing protein n=1 Tax=Mortierella polycephala TaxID=41804 RepID=A0A9P6PQ90_9FUNG|nr:hypothetical protein BG011_008144 [Mortierella polycephala]
MSPSISTDQSPQSFVFSSPDRVVFRTLAHPLASTNKRVTLSLRRSSPSTAATSTTAQFASEPATVPPNAQSPNSHRRKSSLSTQAGGEFVTSAQPLCATSNAVKTALTTSKPPMTTAPAPGIIRKQSVPLLKNGLPIKSAMKNPVAVAGANATSQGRPMAIRSHIMPVSSPKYVHFDTQLEHVRLFLQGEMPSCVGERDTIIDTRDDCATSSIKLTLTNWDPVAPGAFQPGNFDAGATPMRVEVLELSEDQSELQGKILIQNIAFHKHVSVRYTIDYWQTQSEVNAEFEESIPGTSLDRFAFKIPLDMDKSVAEKTFCFAVRYQVIGREFWDSNNGKNYQVECKRVVLAAEPPTSDLSKQKNSILLSSHLPDYSKPLKKKVGGRYDLSTSLSAAYSQPIGVPSRNTPTKLESAPVSQTAYRPSEYIMPIQSPPGYHHSLYASSPKFVNSYLSAASPPEHFHIGIDQLSLDQPIPSKRSSRNTWPSHEREFGFGSSSPVSIPSPRSSSERPAVGSSSYYDLVDRYCFYESSPHSSPYSSYPNSPPATCIRG